MLLLLDGQRLNDGVYDQAPIGKDFPVDVDLIERVEFVPGPGSAVFGANAFFGVLNVITKNGGQLSGARASAEYASYRSGKAMLSYGRRFDNGADLLLSASGYDSKGRDRYFKEFDDPDTNGGVARNLDGEDYRNFIAKFGFGGLNLQAGYGERKKDIPTAAFGQVFNEGPSETTDKRGFASLKYQQAVGERNELTAQLAYGFNDYDGRYVLDYPPQTVNVDGSRSSWLVGEVRLLSTAFAGHKIMVGAEYRKDLRRRQFNYDLETYLDTDRPTRSYGLYVQDEFAITERWTVNAGIRHDYLHENARRITNPRLALIYKPQPKTAIKLLYGTAYRAPNAYEAHYLAIAMR